MIQQIERQFVRTTRPLYGHLVSLLESAISRGDLPSGSRVPPERELAHRLRISRTTVVSAYRELESRGLLRGYVGRGTFVCAAPDPTGAPFAWRGKIAAAALRSSDSTLRDTLRDSSNAKVLSLAAGEPAIDCFPVEAFQQAIDYAIKRERLAIWRHGPTEGQPVLREAMRLVRRPRKCSGAGGRAARARSPRQVSHRSRRCGHRRSAGVSRRDSVVQCRRGKVDRLGCDEGRHGRARGRARALSSEVDLHQPDVPEPDRRRADPREARAAQAGRALSRADCRGRDLPRALLQRGAAAVAPRGSTRRTSSFTSTAFRRCSRRGCGLGGCRRRRRSSIRSRSSSSGSIHMRRIWAVRDGEVHPRRQLRCAPEDAQGRARAPLRDDDFVDPAARAGGLAGSHARKAACISGAGFQPA